MAVNRWHKAWGMQPDGFYGHHDELRTADGDLCTVKACDPLGLEWEASVIPRQGLTQVETCRSRYAAQRACRRMLRELNAS